MQRNLTDPNILRGTDRAANTISSTISATEIIALLAQHQCLDITNQLDLDRCGRFPISGGGFGDIYQGEIARQTRVAIKCARLYIQQDETNRHKTLKSAARELYAWSRFEHDNVMKLLGLATFRDQIAMISPWMDNGTLSQYIDRNPTVDRYILCLGVAEGVAYLHENNTIHGDIKGANVLVSNEGVPKLSDFGCTELKSSTMAFTTTVSQFTFSMRWAAPEVLKGNGKRTKEADVYALGMTLLEIVTGEVPFSKMNDMGIYTTVVFERQGPERPESCPCIEQHKWSYMGDIMENAWASDAFSRPTSTVIRNRLRYLKWQGLMFSGEADGQALHETCACEFEALVRGRTDVKEDETRAWADAVGAGTSWSEALVNIVSATRSLLLTSDPSPLPAAIHQIAELSVLHACALVCLGVNGAVLLLANCIRSTRLHWTETQQTTPKHPQTAHTILTSLAQAGVLSASEAAANLVVQRAQGESSSAAASIYGLRLILARMFRKVVEWPSTLVDHTKRPGTFNTAGSSSNKQAADLVSEPDYSGWMYKKEGQRWRSWKSRYFVLKGTRLYYVSNQNLQETKLIGHIDIAKYKVLADENLVRGRYRFKIEHATLPAHFFSSDELAEAQGWMKALIKNTITRDYTDPVRATCNIPVVPLAVARQMNPRPPSPGTREEIQRAARRKNPTQLTARDVQTLGL